MEKSQPPKVMYCKNLFIYHSIHRDVEMIRGSYRLEMVRGEWVGLTIKQHRGGGLHGNGIVLYLDYG